MNTTPSAVMTGHSTGLARLATWQKAVLLLTTLATIGGTSYYLLQTSSASSKPLHKSSASKSSTSSNKKPSTKSRNSGKGGSKKDEPPSTKKSERRASGSMLASRTSEGSSTSSLVKEGEERVMKNESAVNDIEPSSAERAASLKEEGNAAFKAQEFEKALIFYSQAIELAEQGDSKQLAVYLANRAACYGSLQNWEKVIEDCNAALAADAKYIKCFLRRAAAKFQLLRYEDAAVDYLTICAIEGPNSKTTQANMVKVEECAVAITQKEVESIIKERGSIAFQLPGHPYVAQQFLQYQEEYLTTQQLSEPPSALLSGDRLLMEAVTRLHNHDYEASLESVRKAVTEDLFSSKEWQAKAYNLYATFAVVAMQHDTAIDYFNRSLELDPGYINSLLKLGTLFGVKVSSEKGLEYLEKAIALSGDQQADVQFARATMLADSGDMEGAVALYEKTFDMDQSRTLPLLMLVGIYSVTGMLAKAEAVIRRLVKLFPEDSDVQSTRAELFVRENRPELAIETYDKAMELVKGGQKKPALHIGKATVHIMQGNFDEAETHLNKAIEVDPKFDQTYELLYRSLMSRGELQRALAVLQREVDVFSTFAEESKLTEIIAAKHFLNTFNDLVKRQPDLKTAAMALLNNQNTG